MTEKPFIHKKAYVNVKTNFIFQEDAGQLILKIIKQKGIINLGGPSQTIYNFAKIGIKKLKKYIQEVNFQKEPI